MRAMNTQSQTPTGDRIATTAEVAESVEQQQNGGDVQPPELRKYQIRALDLARESFRRGKRRVILASPTGSGKSLLAAEMARGAVALGKSVVFVVHLRTLVTQFSDRLTADGLAHGIIMANKPDGQPVQIASIQTLSRRDCPEPSLIIIDECKRAASNAYRRLFERWPNAKVIGLDGTPTRIDGRGLGDHFDELITVAQAPELIKQGFLVPVNGFSFVGPSLAGVRTVAGEFNEHQIEERFDQPGIRGQVVEAWLKHAKDRQTIVFAATIGHAEHLAESFRAAGVTATAIHSERKDRDELIAAIPRTQVVVNVGIFQEGYDFPPWSCVQFARATQSVAVWLQGCGRGMRPAPGKMDLLLLDHGGNAARLGLPNEDRHWSLDSSTKQPPRKPDALPITICTKCFASWSRPPRECPSCGHAEPVPLPLIKAGVAVPFSELKRPAPGSESEFERILIRHREHDHKPGRAVGEWKARFPQQEPPWSVWRKYVRPGKGADWLPAD
jgi:superfamily II DNA or RNA helicase